MSSKAREVPRELIWGLILAQESCGLMWESKWDPKEYPKCYPRDF